MSVRQKFRSTLEVRKSDSICWRCALVLPRYASTLQRSEFPDSSRDHTLVQTQQERSEGVRVSIQRRTDTRPYWSSNSQKRDVAIYLDRRRRASLERRENSANDRPTPSIQKFDRLTNYQHSSKLPNSHSTSAPPTVRKHFYVPKETSPSSPLGHGITGKASGRSVGGQDAPISAGASFRRYHWASKPDHKMESSRSSQEQWEANTKSQGRPYATAASQPLKNNTGIDPVLTELDAKLKSTLQEGSLREHLMLWQQQRDINLKLSSTHSIPSINQTKIGQNLTTQSGEDDIHKALAREDAADEVEGDSYAEFGSDEPAPDLLKNETFFRRGELVEVTAGTEPILAIFIQNLADQGQFYTMRGEWFHRNNDYTRFSIPHFVHPDELRDILPYLPTTEVADEMIDKMHPLNASAPRDAGARLLKKMSLFHQTADDAFRKHADRLTRVYEIVAPLEADAGKITMTLGQIAMAVLQKTNPAELTPAMMWAVHRAVTQSQNISYDTLNYRQNAVYEIYPQQNLREIAQVRDWVRDFQEGIIEDVTETYDSDATNKDSKKSRNPIAMFVENARAAVKRSRQTRALAPSGCLGPSSVRLTAPEMSMSTYKCSDYQMLSDQEKTIVRYMDAWAVSRHLNPYTHLKASGPMILRAVGMYDGYELDEVTGFTFLQELGIISPWENLLVHRTPNLRLPDHDRGVEESTRLRKEAYNESKGFAVLKDSMQGLRKDWGDLPVFCIDSAQTVERDDGVSVQDVEDSETEYWVHVHVANPSAFIDPNSATGKYAARLSESVYFPEHKYPMLYPPLTAERLSLASGRPCLTFSARISAEGDILEKKIVPGVVHNVHNLAPSAVARELGIDEGEYSESEKLLTVGGEFSATPNLQADVSDRPSKKSQSGMLRKLLEVGEAIGRRRARNGAPEFHSSDQLGAAYPRVFLGTHDRPYRIRDDAFSTYEGDPFISIEKPSAAHGLVTQMVSNLMILAGEVGASWCMERNMPIPYRGLLRDPEPSCSPEVYKTEVIDASIGKFGTVNPHDLMRYMRLLGRTIGSSTPLEHIALGLPGYCKTTSPLRRHVDMYTHWQIEAAIRHEAATGTSLIGSTDESYLAFSREAVQHYASEAVRRERKLHAAKMAATRHWVIQAFFRAFYFKEAPLPETFKVTALPRHTEMQPGWLEGWNTKVLLTKNKATEDEDGMEPGDVWEARIKEINTYYVNIHMEPIALLERKKPE